MTKNGGISEETRNENKAIRESIYLLESQYVAKGEKGRRIISKMLINEFNMCNTSLNLWLNRHIDFKKENLNKVKEFLKQVK
jgi:hypothetical protein